MDAPYRKLYRSRQDRWLFGVCGGLARYFAIDPTVIRLLFIFAAVFFGHGLLAYVILAILVPIEPEAYPTPAA